MNRLLIVVDYQVDFVDGTLGFPGAEALAGPIAQRIQEYRENGDDVVFTFDTTISTTWRPRRDASCP